MRTALRNAIFFIVLIIVVYFAANYASFVREFVLTVLHKPTSVGSVQGISTNKAQELSATFQSDLYDQFISAKEYTMQLSLGDVVNIISRTHQIPNDFESVKSFTQDYIDRMIQSREKK